MEPISKTLEVGQKELAMNSTESQQNRLPEKKRLPNHWVAGLFKKFQIRYLHRWTSAIEGIEEAAATEWGEVLAGLTGEQIKSGLARLDPEWPPTAGGFRELCLHDEKKHACHKPLAALPRPEVEPEFVESQLVRMREAMK